MSYPSGNQGYYSAGFDDGADPDEMAWIRTKQLSNAGYGTKALSWLNELTGGALVIGAVAGFACLWGVNGLKKMLGADDSLDVFGVHGVGGIVGALRESAYRAALAEHGRTGPASVTRVDGSEESAYRAAVRLLAAADRPSAVVAFNDVCAIAVMSAVYLAGIISSGPSSPTITCSGPRSSSAPFARNTEGRMYV